MATTSMELIVYVETLTSLSAFRGLGNCSCSGTHKDDTKRIQISVKSSLNNIAKILIDNLELDYDSDIKDFKAPRRNLERTTQDNLVKVAKLSGIKLRNRTNDMED